MNVLFLLQSGCCELDYGRRRKPLWGDSVNFTYLQHFLGFLALVDVDDLGFAVSLCVSDQRGDLSHLLLLEDVGLRADPGHDRLERDSTADLYTVTGITGVTGVTGVMAVMGITGVTAVTVITGVTFSQLCMMDLIDLCYSEYLINFLKIFSFYVVSDTCHLPVRGF